MNYVITGYAVTLATLLLYSLRLLARERALREEAPSTGATEPGD